MGVLVRAHFGDAFRAHAPLVLARAPGGRYDDDHDGEAFSGQRLVLQGGAALWVPSRIWVLAGQRGAHGAPPHLAPGPSHANDRGHRRQQSPHSRHLPLFVPWTPCLFIGHDSLS